MNINEVRILKYNRLKPEERYLIKIFDSLVKTESATENSFIYSIDGQIYFEYYKDDNFLFYNKLIWQTFFYYFKYSVYDIDKFITGMVEKYLSLKIITMDHYEFQRTQRTKI